VPLTAQRVVKLDPLGVLRPAGPDEYTRIYRDHLDSLGPEEVVGQLEKKRAENGGKLLVLLCWCSPGEFCHRRVFADWYREKTGQEIPELAKALAA
jgi:hypothetical protein